MESNDNSTPMPTSSASPAGSSRPSTRATSADTSGGQPTLPAKSPLLRQPRSPSVASGSPMMPEPTQMNKRRPSVFMSMRRQSILPYAQNRLVKPKEANVVEPNAAQLAYTARHDSENPYRPSKESVLKQFYLWNGVDVNRLNLPPLPEVKKQVKNMCRAWNGDSQAVRQLGNLTRTGPRHFTELTRFTASSVESTSASSNKRSKVDSPAVQQTFQTSQPTTIEKAPAVGTVHQQWHLVAAETPSAEHPDSGASTKSQVVPPFIAYAPTTKSKTQEGTGTSTTMRPGSTPTKSSRFARVCTPRMSVRSQAKLLEKFRHLEHRRFLLRIDGFIEEMRKCAPLFTIPKKAIQVVIETLDSLPKFSETSHD